MKVKQNSLDSNYKPDKTGIKLNPYDRLQSIFSDKEDLKLTKNASAKLDYILDEGKISLFSIIISKIKYFLKRIDSFIFKKQSRIMNNEFYSRKKFL